MNRATKHILKVLAILVAVLTALSLIYVGSYIVLRNTGAIACWSVPHDNLPDSDEPPMSFFVAHTGGLRRTYRPCMEMEGWLRPGEFYILPEQMLRNRWGMEGSDSE